MLPPSSLISHSEVPVIKHTFLLLTQSPPSLTIDELAPLIKQLMTPYADEFITGSSSRG